MSIADLYWARSTLKTAEKYILFCRQCAETRIAKKIYNYSNECSGVVTFFPALVDWSPNQYAVDPKLQTWPYVRTWPYMYGPGHICTDKKLLNTGRLTDRWMDCPSDLWTYSEPSVERISRDQVFLCLIGEMPYSHISCFDKKILLYNIIKQDP